MNNRNNLSVKFLSLVSLMALVPTIALAQGANPACQGRVGLNFMLCNIGGVLSAAVPVLIGLGVVYFVFGVVTYMIGNDDEAKKKGRDRVIFGVIGLAVIIGVWGLVWILADTFGIGGDAAPTQQINTLLPQIP